MFKAEVDGVDVKLEGLSHIEGVECAIKSKSILVCGDREIDIDTFLGQDGKPIVPKTIGPAKELPKKDVK